MRALRHVVLLLLVWATLPVAPIAGACTSDGECDNGDSCSSADVCASGSCVPGGGGDSDANFICDAEFDPDVDVKVTKMVARTSALAGRDVIRGNGDFIDLGSGGGAFTGAADISFRVKDQLSGVPPAGDGFDVTLVFPSSDCLAAATAVKCRRSAGPGAGSIARFRRNPLATNQVRFSFKLKGFDLTKPFFGPVRIILTHDTIVHRLGLVTDCKLFARGIKCREF